MYSKLQQALLVGAALSAMLPACASAQVFQSQGPGPAVGPYPILGSADNTPNGTVAGAVEAIAVDPSNANVLFIGSPNGGIWKTTDGGKDWAPLTDNQASLSIASLAFDPTDPTHQTLIGGVGVSSNGDYDNFNRGGVLGRGGPQTGLLYTTDGGKDWSALGGSTLAGQTVDAVAARGDVILAGTDEMVYGAGVADTANDLGLYRSTDDGKTFTLVSGAAGSGLPAGPVSSIVGDPNNPNRLYAAVTAPNASSYASTGVYVSNDAGAHWSEIFSAANSGGTIQSGAQTAIKLAVGPNGSLAVAVMNLVPAFDDPKHSSLTGLFLSKDSGSTWTSLTAPFTNPGGQVEPNLAIAIDPKNPNLIYVSGDNACYFYNCNNSLLAYRVDASTGTVTELTDSTLVPTNTADGSTVHPDSRAIVFDANGNLLLSSDGGLYSLNNPQNGTGGWKGLNGNLSLMEPYGVAFDGVSDRLVASVQDNGSSLQSQPGSHLFDQIGPGDGVNAVVNDRTLGGADSAVYVNLDGLEVIQRIILDPAGNVVSPPSGVNYAVGIPVTCDGGQDCGAEVGASFASPLVLNKVDPTLIAVGGSGVYTSRDTLTGAQAINASSIDLALTHLGATSNNVTALAYGARDDVQALLAGDYSSNLYISTTGAAGSLTQLPAYNAAGGAIATSLVFDLRTAQRFFVADSFNLFGTTGQGASFQTLTANLPQGFIRPTSVEFISDNGVNALLVGGMNQPLSCTSAVNGCVISPGQSPITVADSDASGVLSNWRAFGQGLPNTTINQMNYDPVADVLAVSSVGRGAWLLYDVTSYFPQASVLQFGLANNDSAPAASLLTDGTVGDRPLIKYGTGALTIAGNATYTGGTQILGGTLQLGVGGTSGSILGNVVDDGALVFDRSDTYAFSGNITGSGVVVQAGGGTLVLNGDSAYVTTEVAQGSVIVNGTDLSTMLVGGGGLLGGTGATGSIVVMPGGVLAPGDALGALGVQGSVTLSPGSNFVVGLQGPLSDQVRASQTASLAGALVPVFQGGPYVRQYLVLSAAAGVSGSFDSVSTVGMPSFLSASVSYTPTSALLNLTSDLAGTPGLAINQMRVGASLDAGFNGGGGSVAGLFNLPAAALPKALSLLSGEGVTGAEDAAFGAEDIFTRALLREGLASGEAGVMGGTVSRSPGDGALHMWATGFDQAWSLDGQAALGSSTLKHQTGGLAGGVDYRTPDGLVLGLGLGGSFSSLSVAALSTHGDVNGVHVGVFAEKTWPRLYTVAALGYGALSSTTSRALAGVGASETEHGRFSDQLFSGRFEMGVSQTARLPISPFASIAFAKLWQDGFSENSQLQGGGAGVLGLDYAAVHGTSVTSDLGLQTARSWTTRSGATWTPFVRVAWEHEFEPRRSILAAFQQVAGAPAFVVDGARAASDAARIEAGTGLQLKGRISVFANADADLAGRADSYGGRAGIRVSW